MDDEEVLRLFTKATKSMRTVKAVILREYGIHLGQEVVLQMLWNRDGLTPGEMAEQLGASVPTMVKMAQRMESSGLVARLPDSRDGRLVRIYLTPRGRRLQEPVMSSLGLLTKQAMAGLTGKHYEVLSLALSTIITNMESVRQGSGAQSPAEPGLF